tara:strand:- start:896 stop:1282 length:387 start_codon:yes stop_codon:yes gene_type:complete
VHCFNHKSKNAVGVCKNCQKGLCHDCIEVIKDIYLSCKEDSCKANTVEECQITERTKKAYGIGKYESNKPPFVAILYAILGVYFILPPSIDLINSDFNIGDALSVAFGVVFIFVAAHFAFRKEKLHCP